MAKLIAPTPYQYVYNVQGGKVTEHVLVRENEKSFCVKGPYERSSNNSNKAKEYVVWREAQKYFRSHRRNTFGATVKNFEQAIILCRMVFGRANFIKSKYRGKDGSA